MKEVILSNRLKVFDEYFDATKQLLQRAIPLCDDPERITTYRTGVQRDNATMAVDKTLASIARRIPGIG